MIRNINADHEAAESGSVIERQMQVRLVRSHSRPLFFKLKDVCESGGNGAFPCSPPAIMWVSSELV